MKRLVTPKKSLSDMLISRNKEDLSISTFISRIKTYRFIVDKRRVLKDYPTIPFGTSLTSSHVMLQVARSQMSNQVNGAWRLRQEAKVEWLARSEQSRHALLFLFPHNILGN